MEILFYGFSTADKIYKRVNFRIVKDTFMGNTIFIIQDDRSYKDFTCTEKEWRCDTQNIFHNRLDAIKKFNSLVDPCCYIK